MAFFALLIAAVGILAAYFLQANYESIRQINDLTDRAKQVEIINSDMLRSRVDLMVAARYLQESGWGSGQNSAKEAKTALDAATKQLDGVRTRMSGFTQNMLESDTGRRRSLARVHRKPA